MEWLFVWPLYYVWHHHQQDSRTVASARHRQEIRKIYKWRPGASINGGNEFLLIMTCTIQWPEVVRLAYMAKVDIIFSLDFHHINLFRNTCTFTLCLTFLSFEQKFNSFRVFTRLFEGISTAFWIISDLLSEILLFYKI